MSHRRYTGSFYRGGFYRLREDKRRPEHAGGAPAAAAAFEGLLDELGVAAVRAYSMRRLSGDYEGSAIRVRESGGDTEADIGFSGEDLDTAALTAHVGANSGFIAKWYDQSGNGDDLVQATAANQPRIVNAGTIDTRNSVPCPVFDGSNDQLVGSTGFTAREVAAIAATTDAGPSWTEFETIIGGNGVADASLGLMSFDNQGDYVVFTDYWLTDIAVDNGSNAAVFGSVLQQIHGFGSGKSSAAPIIGHSPRGSVPWSGWIGEAMVWSSALSAGQRSTIYTNQKTYWGTP